MTSLADVRPEPVALQQWWVLTVRVIAPTLRNGELIVGIATSAVFTASFYLPLKQVMGPLVQGMSSYAQYLMPLIVLQAVYFAAISAAIRSATDAAQGIDRRFGSMPIAPVTPLAARMSGNVYRCVIAVVIAIASGHVIGFRFYLGLEQTLGFCVLAVLIGATLALLGDLIGLVSKSPEATTHILLLPQLILGLLSVGVQPAEQFPRWIRPFVANQPTSQFVYALRALAGDSTDAAGSPTWEVIGPAVAWLVGMMAIALPLYAFARARRR